MPLIILFWASNFKINFKNAHVLKHPSRAWGGNRKCKNGDCRCRGCRNWIVNLMTVGVRIFLAAAQLKLLESFCQHSFELSRAQLFWQRRGMRWKSKERWELKCRAEEEDPFWESRPGWGGVSRVCRGTTLIMSSSSVRGRPGLKTSIACEVYHSLGLLMVCNVSYQWLSQEYGGW